MPPAMPVCGDLTSGGWDESLVLVALADIETGGELSYALCRTSPGQWPVTHNSLTKPSTTTISASDGCKILTSSNSRKQEPPDQRSPESTGAIVGPLQGMDRRLQGGQTGWLQLRRSRRPPGRGRAVGLHCHPHQPGVALGRRPPATHQLGGGQQVDQSTLPRGVEPVTWQYTILPS